MRLLDDRFPPFADILVIAVGNVLLPDLRPFCSYFPHMITKILVLFFRPLFLPPLFQVAVPPFPALLAVSVSHASCNPIKAFAFVPRNKNPELLVFLGAPPARGQSARRPLPSLTANQDPPVPDVLVGVSGHVLLPDPGPLLPHFGHALMKLLILFRGPLAPVQLRLQESAPPSQALVTVSVWEASGDGRPAVATMLSDKMLELLILIRAPCCSLCSSWCKWGWQR